MSNQERSPQFIEELASSNREITLDPRLVKLTPRSGISIRRTLPHREIRTIGAWCFVDHYGPTDQADAMSIAAHPHTGLQTVSWIFSGEIEHRDSLGSIQIVNPGELNLMTSGAGIAHSELSINEGIQLHGVQLWIVLPDDVRNMEPKFAHHNDLPVFDFEGANIRLMIGELLGRRSSVEVYSELVGAEFNIGSPAEFQLPIERNFEYGLLIDSGDVSINGVMVPVGSLHYLPAGREVVEISSKGRSRILLLGGEPFREKIVMWWNFIGRSHEDIELMRQDWEQHSPRFADFKDRLGGRIPAPPLPNLILKPRSNP